MSFLGKNLQQLITESKNDFSCLSIGEQSEPMQHGQWHPQSQGRPTYQATCHMNQHVQEEFRQ